MDAYIYCADIYCEDCGLDIKADCRAAKVRDEGDSDSFPQGPYADGGGEADCPQHCGNCGVFLENPLTTYGIQYVREALANATGNPDILAEWASFYGLSAADDDDEG